MNQPGIINDFLTTEEFLLAQVSWACNKYLAAVAFREASHIYEEINKQCQGRYEGFTNRVFKAFEERGLDFKTESEKHLIYKTAWNDYLKAAAAHTDFINSSAHASS